MVREKRPSALVNMQLVSQAMNHVTVPVAVLRAGSRQRLRILAAIVLLAVLSAPPAAAEPDDPAPPAATGPMLTLTELGVVAPLAFYGDRGTTELTFPVPRGLIPQSLTATVEIPINVRSGTITVMQRDRTITRVPLPPDDLEPITIPLTGAAIEDDAVTVTLRTYLVPVQGYCLDPTNPLRLTNAVVSFGGTERPPGSVADFLPPVLRKLTIAIPAIPDLAESDAAVRLATDVTAHYGQQPTAITIVRIGAALPPAAPFERRIVIQQGPDTGVVLQPVPGGMPNLRISGPDNELTNQTRLLANDISRLALTSKAVVGPLRDNPQLAGDVTTLRKLGQPVVSAVALAPQVSVGLDQTRMGRPARGIRIHLLGSYTPPPASVSAQLVAIVGGETIDTWSVDDAGVIDRWVDVPDRLLQRYTTLGISLNLAGNTGRCGEFQPLTLTIDGDSVVESEAAVPPVPSGLQSLPQALMPTTLIGIGSDAFADTARATAIAVAMQRLSALPIGTEVTTVDEAMRSRGPAIVIEADGWTAPGVALPVSAQGDRLTLDGVIGPGQSTTLTLDPDLRYGTLQAFFDGHRSLLVATSNSAPGQLDELLRWMTADPRRWSAVDGVAVISAPGQQPVVVRPQPGVSASSYPDSDGSTAWWAAGILIAVAGGAALIFLRTRRATDRPAHDD
jgi:hypothetical protein